MTKSNFDALILMYYSLSRKHIESVGKHEFRSAEEYRKCIETLALVIVAYANNNENIQETLKKAGVL